MSKHTPGPWAVGQPNHEKAEAIGVTSDDWVVADVWRDGRQLRRCAKANARLIAAAPDLLQALKDVMSLHCPHPRKGEPWVDTAARAAIAKAEGK